MTAENFDIPHVTPIDSKSSMFAKTDPMLRRRIDRALVERQPATYKGVYEEFRLHSLGISFTAFYTYASRLRANAASMGLAEVALPEGAAVSEMLPELLGNRLFEAAMDEDATPGTLYRLALSYRIACEAFYARRRFAAEIEDEREEKSRRSAAKLEKEKQKARSNELDELCRMAEQFSKMANQHFEATDPVAPDPAPTQHSSPPAGSDIDPQTKALLASVQTKLRAAAAQTSAGNAAGDTASALDPETIKVMDDFDATMRAATPAMEAEAAAAVKAIEAGEGYPPAAGSPNFPQRASPGLVA
jgi:hypothetical protein